MFIVLQSFGGMPCWKAIVPRTVSGQYKGISALCVKYIEKVIQEYADTKRTIMPNFYFYFYFIIKIFLYQSDRLYLNPKNSQWMILYRQYLRHLRIGHYKAVSLITYLFRCFTCRLRWRFGEYRVRPSTATAVKPQIVGRFLGVQLQQRRLPERDNDSVQRGPEVQGPGFMAKPSCVASPRTLASASNIILLTC